MKPVLRKAAAGISSFALSAAILAGSVPVYAAGTTVSVGSAKAKAGESVTVDVKIDGNTGMSNFDLKVSYDDALTLKSVSKNGYLCADGIFVANTNAGLIIWADSKDCETTSGTLFSLTFDVSDSAKSGDYDISIGLKDGGTVSGSGKKLYVEFDGGTLTVVGNGQTSGGSGSSGGSSSGGNSGSSGSSGSTSSGNTSSGSTSGTTSSGSSKSDEKPIFTDVLPSAWYYQPVSELSAAKVVSGYPDGSFRPSGNVTYAEALKLILLASGYSVPAAKAGTHWASAYYDLALGAGLIKSDIGLDSAISRIDIARIIAGAIGIESSTEASPFTDCSDGSVTALYKAGLIKGYEDNKFGPQNTITRAEMSMIIWRLYSYAATGQVNG